MSAATAARKPRNTAASLIASEFNARQKSSKQEVASPVPAVIKSSVIWDEEMQPTPIEQHPVTEKQTASPVILVLIAFVAVTILIKLSIALILIATKLTKKIAHQIAAFWATQMGGEKIDFRIYSAIFD